MKIKKLFNKRHKKKYGHWAVYSILVILVIGLWRIPMDVYIAEVTEFGAKIRFLSTTIRLTVEDLTVTVKSMGTLTIALAALAYSIYSNKGSGKKPSK